MTTGDPDIGGTGSNPVIHTLRHFFRSLDQGEAEQKAAWPYLYVYELLDEVEEDLIDP